jgi:D-alanine-D-alanine ligase
MKRLRVAVIFGGRSGEHDVSLISATSIIQALDPKKYDVVPIGITREGRWLRGNSAEKLLPAKSVPESVIESGSPIVLAPEPGALRRAGEDSAPELDIAIPVLHGTFGEDGTIQGLLELADIPYVGAGVLGSAVSMDKEVMKRLFVQAGLPVVPWVTLQRREWERQPAKALRLLARQLKYPMFVKPANLGSSVGISKVHKVAELGAALDLAAQYDSKIVVEQGVDARELECSVLGNDDPRASLPGEVKPCNEFYDYEAKYVKSGSEILIPAPLSPAMIRKVQQLAVGAFRAVDCSGLARVDFFLERMPPAAARAKTRVARAARTPRLFVNEINTMPGFTPISMFPKMWAASGLAYPQLLDEMIRLGLERAAERRRNRYS